MTIKTKLTLNVVIVLLIVCAVVTTSVIGMVFVKRRLFYLTEQSTPFQLRTVDFQRTMQTVTADLIKVGTASKMEEYQASREAALKSLEECRLAQNSLETLSGGRQIEAYDEVDRIARDVFRITEERLLAEKDAGAAAISISQKLKETLQRLRELDSSVKRLQANRSGAFVTSMNDTKGISSRLRKIELLKATLKDLQIAYFEIRQAREKKALIIGRGKSNSAIGKTLQNDYLRGDKNLLSNVKAIEGKMAEMVNLRMSLIGQQNTDTKDRYEAANREVGEKVSSLLLTIEQEEISAADNYRKETDGQGTIFTQASTANSVLISNSELVALGFSVEGLSTRLFTLTKPQEVEGVDADLGRVFERIDSTRKNLATALVKLDAKEEMKVLRNAEGSLSSIRTLLMEKDGVLAKIRHQLAMRTKAFEATERLRDTVLKQAEKGRESVTAARGEQEKAIGTVNRMVRFSIFFIAAISIGAVIVGVAFGTWVYRSIAQPLGDLMRVSNDVAQGNLKNEIKVKAEDEVGIVQAAMAKMVTNLSDIVGKIRSATGSLASSSEELSMTAAVLGKGSQEQTVQIEQSATAMNQMSQTIMDVARNALDTSDAAQKMNETALQGKEAMCTTVKVLTRFVDTVRDSADKIESLGQKSARINGIVTLIKDIADQTNLLALNAAIEAARAGEQGRGFAVVADSVRQLAERTTQATNEIGQTVKVMDAEIADSVSIIREEKMFTEKVLADIEATLKLIDAMASYVGNVTDRVQRIATATEEQSSTAEEVSQTMDTIAGVTRNLGNSVAEIKRSSEDLSQLASELNAMTGWFAT